MGVFLDGSASACYWLQSGMGLFLDELADASLLVAERQDPGAVLVACISFSWHSLPVPANGET